MASQPLLTVSQVAEEFQVTTQTIRNWIDGGALPAAKIGRAFRVKREDVDELLASHTQIRKTRPVSGAYDRPRTDRTDGGR